MTSAFSVCSLLQIPYNLQRADRKKEPKAWRHHGSKERTEEIRSRIKNKKKLGEGRKRVRRRRRQMPCPSAIALKMQRQMHR